MVGSSNESHVGLLMQETHIERCNCLTLPTKHRVSLSFPYESTVVVVVEAGSKKGRGAVNFNSFILTENRKKTFNLKFFKMS